MKKLVLASVVFSALSFTANASMKAEVKFVGDVEYASFCKAVVNDNVKLFKRSLKRFVGPLGGSKQDVLNRVLDNNNVQCSGQNLTDFASSRDAQKVAAYITKNAA